MIAVYESVTSEGRAIDVRVEDGIDVRILPDRGFDLGDAWRETSITVRAEGT